MNISQHQAAVEKSFELYEAIQAKHLAQMRNDEMPDLNTMNKERSNASDNLQQTLNSFVENAGSLGGSQSLPLLNRFEKRLNKIMALDADIATEIEKHRDKIKKSMAQMKQGKQALTGYWSAGNETSPNRVVHISR